MFSRNMLQKDKMNSNLSQIGTAELLIRFYDKNDEGALSEFFLRFKDLAFRIAYNVLGNVADAEDITQQTFVHILKKQAICNAAYQGDDYKVKSWLLAIIYNSARMQYNANKKNKTYELKEGLEVESTKETDNSIDNALSSKVHTAIFDLPEKYRIPILMRYHQDMSIDEISKTLASQPGTIRSILSRGVSLLRNKLSGEKNLMSATAVIELVANISYPIPKFDVSLGLIKSINATNPFVTSAIKKSQAKISLFMKSAIVLSLSATVATGFMFFYPKENITSNLASKATDSTIQITPKAKITKTSWDFTKEKGEDLVFIQNSIIYNETSKSITNKITDKIKPQAAVIRLPLLTNSPSKIFLKAKINTERGMYRGDDYHNSLEYVPILKNNTPLMNSLLYHAPVTIEKSSVDKNNRYQSNIIFYNFENVTVVVQQNQNAITKIQRFDGLNENPYIGFIIANFDVESIEILPLEEKELNEIKEKALGLLEKQKESKK